MHKLTPRQREVLEFIETWVGEFVYAPTFREIGEAMDISPNAVVGHLNSLENKGYITRGRKRARAIELVRETLPGIPLVGVVSDGFTKLNMEAIANL